MVRRNRRGGVEDRWTKIVRDECGNQQRVRSARHGKGMRWLARYVDDEGRERSKAFVRKADAQQWLDTEVIAPLVTGTYVAPKAGLVTVGEVYAAWSDTVGHLSAKTVAVRRGAWVNRVAPHWADVPVSDVRASGVKAWVARMVATTSGLRQSRTLSGCCVRYSELRWRTTALPATRATG